MLPFQLLIAVLGGWLHREQADVIAFLGEEDRLLKARLAGRPLAQVATLATPDTIVRRQYDRRLQLDDSKEPIKELGRLVQQWKVNRAKPLAER